MLGMNYFLEVFCDSSIVCREEVNEVFCVVGEDGSFLLVFDGVVELFWWFEVFFYFVFFGVVDVKVR